MKRLIVVQFIGLLCIYASGQQTFIKTIDDVTNGSSIRVLPTSDQGWVVFSLDSLKLYKFNRCGVNEWNKQYSLLKPYNTQLEFFIKTQSGGFAILTQTNSPEHIPLLTVLNASGDIIWSKLYGDPVYEHYPYTIGQDNTGNFILYSNLSPDSYNMICKIDGNGNIIWTKFYNWGGTWGGALVTSDNGVLFRVGVFFVKTDNDGNVQWTSRFQVNTYHYLAPVEVSDGFIFNGYIMGNNQIVFYKMDMQGNLLWNGRKTLDYFGTPPSLRKKSNGNIVGVFNKGLFPTVIEFDKDLNVVNQSSLNYSEPGVSLYGSDICFINDSTPILTGIATVNSVSKLFFAKMNSQYQTSCDTVLAVNITQDTITQSFLNTNVISYNLNAVNQNFVVDSFSVSQTTLCTNPQYLDIGKDTLLCENATITLQNNTYDLFDTYLWSTSETTATITTNNPGIYWLLATYNCGTNSKSDTIQVTTVPVVVANLGVDLLECDTTPVVFTAPDCGNCTYTWSTGSSFDSIIITEHGTYWLKVENSNGCTSTDTAKAEFIKCECDFYMPNVFTPNNDGLNELFKPVYYCDFYDYSMMIYNRWGQLIYLTNEKEIGWNGKLKKQSVQEGIYVYIINYTPVIKGKLKNPIQKVGIVAVIY